MPLPLLSIASFNTSPTFETNLYSGNGIDQTNFKPLAWTKQKVDKVINGEIVYKSRDSIEAQVFPTAKIINTIESSDTEIFVEDADECFAAAKASKRYSSNNMYLWYLLLVPKEETRGTCRLILTFLYNGYNDKRLVYIDNL